MVAMATAVRRHELASIRLLGGVSGLCLEMVTLETATTVLVGFAVGILIVGTSLLSVPVGATGVPIHARDPHPRRDRHARLTAGLAALRASPRSAARAQPNLNLT